MFISGKCVLWQTLQRRLGVNIHEKESTEAAAPTTTAKSIQTHSLTFKCACSQSMFVVYAISPFEFILSALIS